MKLEQVFFGRGENGYCILGSSLPDCGLTDRIAELCQSVGTPGFERPEDKCPFLLQKTVGTDLVMACGRNGPPDSMGRETLFFHVLVAPRAEAERRGVHARLLYERRAFVATFPGERRPPALEVDIGTAHDVPPAESVCLELPAVIRCRRADGPSVVERLTDRVLFGNWSTISWNVLPEFDFYGLDEAVGSSKLPPEMNVYDVKGNLLRAAAKNPPSWHSGGRQDTPPTRNLQSGDRQGSGVKALVLVGVVCWLLGLALGYYEGSVRTERNTPPASSAGERGQATPGQNGSESPKNVEMAREELRRELETQLRPKLEKSIREELSRSTPKIVFQGKRIVGFEDLKVLPGYELAMSDPQDRETAKERDMFRRLQSYIQFVNDNFPETKKENQK